MENKELIQFNRCDFFNPQDNKRCTMPTIEEKDSAERRYCWYHREYVNKINNHRKEQYIKECEEKIIKWVEENAIRATVAKEKYNRGLTKKQVWDLLNKLENGYFR